MQAAVSLVLALLLVALEAEGSTIGLDGEIQAARARRRALLAELVSLGDTSAPAPLPPRSEATLWSSVSLQGAPPESQDDRDPPDEAFDVYVGLAPAWTGDSGLIQRRFDADGDGLYEEIWFLDPERDTVSRKHIDRNRDGRIDCWREYRDGVITAQALDSDFDGRPEVWEQYEGGRTVARQIDRDEDGRADTFLLYSGELLVEEGRDEDGDGLIDVRSIYRDGQLVRREFLESTEGSD